MIEPYSVLGVSKNCTDEELKKAYRNLARKYHPDNYAGSDMQDVAEERMKEINEAYDIITKERAARANGGTENGYGQSYNRQNANGTPPKTPKETYLRIRALINGRRFAEADVILDGIPSDDRGAEWNYLKGCTRFGRGWYLEARRYFEAAAYMDPYNTEYQTATQNMRNSANARGRTDTTTDTCSGCDICSGLICADCLCECCGGDLIRCC